MESRIGRITQNMLVIGRMIEQMVKVNYIMHPGIFMKVNGKMIVLMAKEPIIKKMEENILEIGLKINNMVMVKKLFQMVLYIKVNLKMELKMERV